MSGSRLFGCLHLVLHPDTEGGEKRKKMQKQKKQYKKNKHKLDRTPPRGYQKKTIIPARDPKQCCGVFLLEIVDAKSVSGSVHQNPVVLLLQGVFVRISASAASRATCARSLYAGLLSKIALSGSLRQDPVVGPLVQDHCMRISCARCLSRDVCMRSL